MGKGIFAVERKYYLSKADLVAEGLRDMITQGEISAGDVLRQRELAERFGVSQTPVREALRQLESEGLISSDLHRGSIVAEVAFEDLEENFQIRAALESLASRIAAGKASDQDIEDIEALHEKFKNCDPTDREQVMEINRQFHFRIYESAGLPLLLSLTRLLWQALPQGAPSLAPRPHKESLRQHTGILKALKTGDRDQAEHLTKEHITAALKYALKDSKDVRVARPPK